MAPFDRSHTSSYYRSIVWSYLVIFQDKARHWSKIAFFHTPPAFDAPVNLLGPSRNIVIRFDTEKKLECCGYTDDEKSLMILCLAVST